MFKKEGDVSFHDTSLTPKELEIIKNTEYAVLFKSKNLNNLGVISALHYHIGAINSSTVALKIHFYKADETKHIPADELLSIQAVAKGPNENSWYSLDLRRYKVLMPKEGCYISVRVSCTEGEPPMSDAFVNYVVPSGELILPLHDGKRQTVRRLAPREKWKRNGYFGTQGIKVEIDAVE